MSVQLIRICVPAPLGARAVLGYGRGGGTGLVKESPAGDKNWEHRDLRKVTCLRRPPAQACPFDILLIHIYYLISMRTLASLGARAI